MTTPASLFVPIALAALSMVATPAQADQVRDHRSGDTTRTVRDHRRAAARPVSPPPRQRRSRPIIQPPQRTHARAAYHYDGGTWHHSEAYGGDLEDRVWIPGSWQLRGNQWVWIEGRWVAGRPGLTDPGPSWVHPRDRWTRNPEDWLRN